MSKNFIFSSESVGEGHPDKVSDTISDAVLDACLAIDPKSRVACETFVKSNVALVGGERGDVDGCPLPPLPLFRLTESDAKAPEEALGPGLATPHLVRAVDPRRPCPRIELPLGSLHWCFLEGQ